MTRLRVSALLCILLSAASTAPAQAQYYQNGDTDAAASTDAVGNAHLEVRLTQLEEQLHQMQGSIERLSNENNQLKAQLEKTNADTQYRLGALEQKQAPAAAASVAAPPASDQLQPTQPEGQAATDNADGGGAAASTQFASSRDHYNYAYKLLIQNKYADAGGSFSAFTRQYPHDPLIGNAYYWLGETFYVRRDYLKAADSFRQGYEAMPTGPKAADNLLKLAMSLNDMNKNKEACVVLRQVSTKFTTSSSSVASRAEQESNRIGCE